MIIHIDIDAFFASVEKLLLPSLRERPVAVGTGCIASCCYIARSRGLHAGMGLSEARQVCPDLVIMRGSYPVYRCFAARVWELCREVSPAVDTYLDDAYLDMAGTERLYGEDPSAVIAGLRRRIRDETGLAVSAGIGPNRMIARLAGRSAKPDGLRTVLPGEVDQFIIKRPVSDIPGVGRRTAQRFADINVYTIDELRRLPRRTLINLLGRNGSLIYDRARGIDTRPVSQREVPETISRESSFHRETGDPREIRAMLYYLVERALKAARGLGLVASRVGLRIRYEDFVGDETTRRLPRSTDLEEDVYAMALTLLRRLHTRRVSLRLIGIVLSGLAPGSEQQMDLFEAPNQRGEALAAALDDVRAQFGFGAITSGPSLDLLNRMRRDRDGYVLRTPCLTK